MAGALTFQTNQGASIATAQLLRVGRSLNNSIKALASGIRVHSAGVDAAGLAVSENLRAQLLGFQKALQNGSEGVSMLQVAESGYQSISDSLIHMRELAVEASNDSLSDTERGFLDTEFQELEAEVTRVSDSTEYNNVFLLDGSAGTLTFQVGTRGSTTNEVTVVTNDNDATQLGTTGEDLTSQANAQAAIDVIDDALETLNTNRTTVGSAISRLNKAIDHLTSVVEGYTAAVGTIRDTDMAAESANFAALQVQQQASVAMLAQANQSPSLVLQLLG